MVIFIVRPNFLHKFIFLYFWHAYETRRIVVMMVHFKCNFVNNEDAQSHDTCIWTTQILCK